MLLVKDYRSIQSHTKDEGRNHLVGSVVCTDRLLLFEHEILEDTLSQEDIIALMCPSECRSSKANPVVDEIVFNFLTLRLSHCREALVEKESLFGNKQARLNKCFYKARVEDDLSHSWQQFLNIFDPLHTGCISLKQILRSGLICPEVAQFMCHQVGNGHMFCRNDFLAEMTKISKRRWPLRASPFARALSHHKTPKGRCLRTILFQQQMLLRRPWLLPNAAVQSRSSKLDSCTTSHI